MYIYIYKICNYIFGTCWNMLEQWLAWPEKSDFSGFRWMTASRLPRIQMIWRRRSVLDVTKEISRCSWLQIFDFFEPKRGGGESLVRKFHDFILKPSEVWIHPVVKSFQSEFHPHHPRLVSGKKAMDCGFLWADPEEVFHQAGHAPGRSLVVKRLGKE